MKKDRALCVHRIFDGTNGMENQMKNFIHTWQKHSLAFISTHQTLIQSYGIR